MDVLVKYLDKYNFKRIRSDLSIPLSFILYRARANLA
jgi:hypothetical protein